ncbi:MAG TPA: hypothetical protein VKG43_04885 [Acidimicrobiales bacterium]|nr:hypothetical protein [Acidimicrobiales bacterium]
MTTPQQLTISLAQERRSLDFLVFKLEVQKLLLESGALWWTKETTAEIESAVSEVQSCARTRQRRTAAVASSNGLPEGAPLVAVIGVVGDPWDGILSQSCLALSAALGGVESFAAEHVERLVRSTAALAERGAETPPGLEVHDLEDAVGTVRLVTELCGQLSSELSAQRC